MIILILNELNKYKRIDRHLMDKLNLCKNHQMPIIFIDKGTDIIQQFLCKVCLQTKFNVQPFEDFYSAQLKVLDQINQQAEKGFTLLKEFLQGLAKFKHYFLQSIEQFTSKISQIMKNIEEQKLNYKTLIGKITEQPMDDVQDQQNNIVNLIHGVKDQIQNDLIQFTNVLKTDFLFNILKNCNLQIGIDESFRKKVKLEQFDKAKVDNGPVQPSININKKFDYQLIEQSSYKQNTACRAIAFNNDASIMIAGCDKLIKIFEFKQEKLRELQQLSAHTAYVVCLQFLRKSRKFISGSSDNTIIFWEQNSNNLWQNNQVLKAHTAPIFCITINKNEDLIISGSNDKTIKFWQNENTTWSSQQSIDCSSHIYSISLSTNEDKLIASNYDNEILVIQQNQQKWSIIQKLQTSQFSWRLCFISQDQFLCQPFDRQHLIIYEYDKIDQKFKEETSVKYPNKENDGHAFFPIQYIPQIGLILVKNDQYVHLIRKQQNRQFIVEQSIRFSKNCIYGCVSDNGYFIATWDDKSKEIQIRKFKQ